MMVGIEWLTIERRARTASVSEVVGGLEVMTLVAEGLEVAFIIGPIIGEGDNVIHHGCRAHSVQLLAASTKGMI